MIDPNTAMRAAFARRPLARNRREVEPVSQIHLFLHGSENRDAFETARGKIREYAQWRAEGPLPREAWDGKAFSTDDVGARRVEATAYNAPVADWTEPGRLAAGVSREDANRRLGFEM